MEARLKIAIAETRTMAPTIISGSSKPDKMVTLICGNCHMALYMSERILTARTWKCPSCGSVTQT
jgi:hypothetical protein